MEDLSFDSTDLSETQDFLVSAYARLQVNGHDPQPRTQIQRRWLGSTNVDELEFDFDMDFAVEPLGRLCVCRIHSGHLETRFGRVDNAFAPGEVAVLAPPNRPYTGHLHRTRYQAIMLDTGQLDRVAAPPAGRFRRSVRLTGHQPVSSAAAAQLITYIDYLRSHILVTSRAKECELIADTGTQLLAALILAAFPNTAQADSSPLDHHDASTAALRRAVSYIDDNAHLPVSLADIADHVHMTPRGVQYLFRRHMDCTPMQYLRQVRLDLAHRDLQVGTPDRCTVAEVAMKWGFSHQSRFAHYYKQAYGTSPHRTLKR